MNDFSFSFSFSSLSSSSSSSFIGIMDQIACSFGSHGSILPIACMECFVANPVYLPDDAILVGFPTKVQHHLSGGESPYQRARTATAMAAKIAEVESLSEVATVTMSRFEKDLRGLLPPGKMSGSDFIEKYGAVGQVDELSEVSPEVEYPVADAFEFAVQANFFAGIVLSLLESAPFAEEHNQEKILRQIGEIMLLQHNSYTKIGLGKCLASYHIRYDALYLHTLSISRSCSDRQYCATSHVLWTDQRNLWCKIQRRRKRGNNCHLVSRDSLAHRRENRWRVQNEFDNLILI